MKKIALTSLVAALAVSAANAATTHFVGGAAAIATDSDHASILAIAPEFGWKYDSNWDLGLNARLGWDHKALAEEYGINGETYEYGVGAFARYKVAQFGGVKLLLKGSVGADFVTYSPDEGDAETKSSIGAEIIPMITYDISESFTLYANLNFLGVYAGYDFKNDNLGVKDGWTVAAFGDADDVANTGNFQIGFTYNF